GRAAYDPAFGAYTVGATSFDDDGQTYDAIGGEAGVRVYPVRGLDLYLNYAFENVELRENSPNAALYDDQRTPQHKINAGVQVRTSFGLDLSLDFHFVDAQRWRERIIDVARGGVAFFSFDLPAYTQLNARIGYRLLDDRLDLGIVGTNLTGEHREHPFGQPTQVTIVGTAGLRF
ncbi:MAG: TonB-dependent receptor, partial [Deltaproteobacteria bacterium]|nr:TonB-dependent receptor [Deltaproteobacteria bacterium]